LQVKEVIRKERHKNQQETRRALNKLRSGAGTTAATTGGGATGGGNPGGCCLYVISII